MKEVYFKTSKGDFIAVEIPDIQRYNLSRMAVRNDFYRLVCKLSEMTEEDASKVVDKYLYNTNSEDGDCEVYKDYTTGDICFTTALVSLHSLLKSKGIDVNKGNWYLFKKI